MRGAGMAALIAGLLAAPGVRAEGLDVEGWLRRPGARLVAVEIYATWCKPCMEAVPRWRALHERYRAQGLRLVVVATRDAEAGCPNPGWSPDEIVCDDDGRVAEGLGAGKRLPAAFLWTWDGQLLVGNGHVDAVEQAVGRYFAREPRVLISPSESGAELASLLRAELARDDKLPVIDDPAERARAEQIRRQVLEQKYGAAAQCEVGEGLSRTSVLGARVVERKAGPLLHLGLMSAERGCLVASSAVGWLPSKPAVSVAEGIAQLMSQLRRPVSAPTGPSARPPAAPPAEAPPAEAAPAEAPPAPPPAPAPDLVPPPLVASPPPARSSLHWWLLGGGGVTLAGGGVATVLGYTALASAAEDAETSEALGAAKTRRDVARVAGVTGVGVGGALIAGALIAYLAEAAE